MKKMDFDSSEKNEKKRWKRADSLSFKIPEFKESSGKQDIESLKNLKKVDEYI